MRTTNLFLLIALVSASGCASFSSTIMSRNPDDRLTRNSNQCVKGIPVTVKIPTHVDAVITEEYFIVQGGAVNPDHTLNPKVASLTKIPDLGKPLRSVNLTTIYTPKVLTTNFVRPLAGNLTLGAGDGTSDGITIDADNYFGTIKSTIDDQTLEDITAAIPDVKKILGIKSAEAKKVSAGGDATALSKCESFKSVIAYRRFDINEPGWEQELQAFVDGHIGCQQQPCGQPECYQHDAVQYESHTGSGT